MSLATAVRFGVGTAPRPASGRRRTLSLDKDLGDNGFTLHHVVGTCPDASPLELEESLSSWTADLPADLRDAVHRVAMSVDGDHPPEVLRRYDKAVSMLRRLHEPRPATPKPKTPKPKTRKPKPPKPAAPLPSPAFLGFKSNRNGYIGIKQTRDGTYSAECKIDGKRTHLGTFPTPEEAARAYDAAAIRAGRPPMNFRPAPPVAATPAQSGALGEVDAMASIARSLSGLSPDAARRVLAYLNAAFAADAAPPSA